MVMKNRLADYATTRPRAALAAGTNGSSKCLEIMVLTFAGASGDPQG
jgi:hypothetical protein